MEYNPISRLICALGFHFCSRWGISGTFGVFFIDAVAWGSFYWGSPALLRAPLGTFPCKAHPHPQAVSFSPSGIFISEDLSLSFPPSERLIRYLGHQCSCGTLYFNSISGEQHPVLIFHFGLFFLGAFLLVWLCEFAPTCYQALAFILWALICIKPKSEG